MNNLALKIYLCIVLICGVMTATAQDEHMYEIRITNTTYGQPMAPVLAVAHNKNFSLFTIGESAGRFLGILAETGNPIPLRNKIAGRNSIYGTEVFSGIIPPGRSTTITISTTEAYPYLSLASMYGYTNDGFVGLRGVALVDGAEYQAAVYDAGTEENTEAARDVPDLGGGGRRTADSEGFVTIHRGVHGVADLDPAKHDWRHPGAIITIKRIK